MRANNQNHSDNGMLRAVLGMGCFAAEVPAETVNGSLMGGGASASTQFVEVPCG